MKLYDGRQEIYLQQQTSIYQQDYFRSILDLREKIRGVEGKLRYKPKVQSFHQKSVEKIKIAVLELGAVVAHVCNLSS